jgi:ATP-dependent RNA helicase DeaD
MTEPFEVTVGKANTGNKNIDHQFFVISAQHRYETLKRLIDFNPGIYGLIFTPHQVRCAGNCRKTYA